MSRWSSRERGIIHPGRKANDHKRTYRKEAIDQSTRDDQIQDPAAEKRGLAQVLGDIRAAVPPQSECYLGADGDTQRSGHYRRQSYHAARLGYELSRAGLRHLYDGHRRHSASILFGADRRSL